MEFYRGSQTKWNFAGGPDKIEFTRGTDKIEFNKGYRLNGILQGVPDKMEF